MRIKVERGCLWPCPSRMRVEDIWIMFRGCAKITAASHILKTRALTTPAPPYNRWSVTIGLDTKGSQWTDKKIASLLAIEL
jgi:hypothetical protein